MNPRYLIVPLLVLAGLTVWAVLDGRWFRGAPPVPVRATRPQEVAREVIALGWLEPAGGVLNVSAAPGDRVSILTVRKGDQVAEGAVLGTLESYAVRKLEVEGLEKQLSELKARRGAEETLADARVKAAEVSVEKAKSAQLEVTSRESEARVLESTLRLAEKDLARLKRLSDEIISQQERERQALVVEKTTAELQAARSSVAQLKQVGKLAIEAAQADLQAAQAARSQVVTAFAGESLEKRLDLARVQLKQSEIRAPAAGTVLNVIMRPGEMVDTRPILQLADVRDMVCIAEVYETDVKRLAKGQRVTVLSKAFPAPYDVEGLQGSVIEIGQLIATPQLRSLDPFARTDRHVVRVKCTLDSAAQATAADLVNLQVDVRFEPDGAAKGAGKGDKAE